MAPRSWLVPVAAFAGGLLLTAAWLRPPAVAPAPKRPREAPLPAPRAAVARRLPFTAEAGYESAVAADPTSRAALFEFALLLARSGDPGRRSRANRLLGTDAEAAALRPAERASRLAALGALDQAEGRLDAALPRLEEADRLEPSFDTKLALALLHRARSESERALPYYLACVDLRPTDRALLAEVVRRAEASSDRSRVTPLLDRLRAVAPDQAAALERELGPLHATGVSAESYEGAAREALAVFPDDPLAFQMLALACLTARRDDEAEAHLDAGLATFPDCAGLLAQKALLFERRGRFDRALDLYRRALRSRPDHPLSYQRLSVLLEKLKRWAELLAVAEARLAAIPGELPGTEARAIALEGLGRADEAVAALRGYLAAPGPFNVLTAGLLNLGDVKAGRQDLLRLAQAHVRPLLVSFLRRAAQDGPALDLAEEVLRELEAAPAARPRTKLQGLRRTAAVKEAQLVARHLREQSDGDEAWRERCAALVQGLEAAAKRLGATAP